FRDSGVVNGYSEGEWVPFVAIIDGTKLADADGLAGGTGDGLYGASFIVPTYSTKHDANAIMDVTSHGTYGVDVTPIRDPFDNGWLIDNGYWPLVFGAYSDAGDFDAAPFVDIAAQREGPTRFAPGVASVEIPFTFKASPSATHVEVRFAVRLALPNLTKIA